MYGVFEQGPVNKAEWRWALGWGVVVAAVSCLPFLYAYWAPPAGQNFSGFLVNYQDGNSYLAKMREGYDGNWLFTLAFTPEQQSGLLVFTLYLGLGHLARLTGLPLIFVFHLARALSGVFLLVSVYRLAAEFTPNLAARRWAFAIAAFGGGLALISLLLGRNNSEAFTPVDLFVPEAIGFYSILSNPHFCLAFALEAWAIIWVINPPRWNQWLVALLGGLIGLAIASMAPYLTPVAWLIAAAALFAKRPIPKPAIIRLGVMVVVSGLFLLYAYWAMNTDPAIVAWARQNLTPSPPPLDVLLGLGLWLLLAGLGAWLVYKQQGLTSVLAACLTWLLVSLILLYVPYALQRRFIGGIFVPLAVLSGPAIPWLINQAGRARPLALAGLFILGFTSNILVLTAILVSLGKADSKIYLTNDEVAALQWLEGHAVAGDVVLADERLGLFVPGWTGARTVYGHPMETIDATLKRAEVERYYVQGNAIVLNKYPVTFILGGPPPMGWHMLYQSGSLAVYGH